MSMTLGNVSDLLLSRIISILPEQDKDEYLYLCDCIKEKHQKSSIKKRLKLIQRYIFKYPELRDERSILCGILFKVPYIIINFQQIKNIIAATNSELTSFFQNIKYKQFALYSQYYCCVKNAIPSEYLNETDINRWKVYYPTYKSETCICAPSPNNIMPPIPLDSEQPHLYRVLTSKSADESQKDNFLNDFDFAFYQRPADEDYLELSMFGTDPFGDQYEDLYKDTFEDFYQNFPKNTDNEVKPKFDNSRKVIHPISTILGENAENVRTLIPGSNKFKTEIVIRKKLSEYKNEQPRSPLAPRTIAFPQSPFGEESLGFNQKHLHSTVLSETIATPSDSSIDNLIDTNADNMIHFDFFNSELEELDLLLQENVSDIADL